MNVGITGALVPNVAWCKTCNVGRKVVNVSADDRQIEMACGHGRSNPLWTRPQVCSCADSPIGWSSDCPLPEHYIPPKGRR